jgi:tRNA(adenine34) deaminase
LSTKRKDDLFWIKEALQEALKSGNDVPIGAVIVCDGKIIGRGYNKREQECDISAHAEIIAIKQAEKTINNWRLTDAIIYTTLEPCPMCAEAIIQSRLAKVIFGAYDPINGAAGSSINLFDKNRKCYIPEIIGGINEIDCKKILVEFFSKRR